MHIFDGMRPQVVISTTQPPIYEFYNASAGALADPIYEHFELLAPPDSKLSRNRTGDDCLTAPMMLSKLEYPLVLCEVTVAGELAMDRDQGGLVVFCGGVPVLPNRGHTRPQSTDYEIIDRQLDPRKCRWARVGIELIAGEYGVSSVVANPGCSNDSCFTPLPHIRNVISADHELLPSLRVKLERVANDLWLWYKVPGPYTDDIDSGTPEMMSRQWRKCREISGFFDDGSTEGGVWVGCYASRPSEVDNPEDEDSLFMEFDYLEIL